MLDDIELEGAKGLVEEGLCVVGGLTCPLEQGFDVLKQFFLFSFSFWLGVDLPYTHILAQNGRFVKGFCEKSLKNFCVSLRAEKCEKVLFF